MMAQFLICQVDSYVCFLMVGTYCSWGLTVYNKQCQTLGHNNRPLWNPENYTLTLSSIIGFSFNCTGLQLLSKVRVTFSQEDIMFVQDQKRELT